MSALIMVVIATTILKQLGFVSIHHQQAEKSIFVSNISVSFFDAGGVGLLKLESVKYPIGF